MGFQELQALAVNAGLVVNKTPAAVVPARNLRGQAEAKLNRLGDVVDELLRAGVRFLRFHPRLAEFRSGTVTEHMRQRVRLEEARVARKGRTTNRKHMCPTEWVGRLYEQD